MFRSSQESVTRCRMISDDVNLAQNHEFWYSNFLQGINKQECTSIQQAKPKNGLSVQLIATQRRLWMFLSKTNIKLFGAMKKRNRKNNDPSFSNLTVTYNLRLKNVCQTSTKLAHGYFIFGPVISHKIRRVFLQSTVLDEKKNMNL